MDGRKKRARAQCLRRAPGARSANPLAGGGCTLMNHLSLKRCERLIAHRRLGAPAEIMALEALSVRAESVRVGFGRAAALVLCFAKLRCVPLRSGEPGESLLRQPPPPHPVAR